ncbi:PEP-CTERM sorting domain-containing protein [Accumulibacter sp.]|uniref:PEP-CTERM sorting domain-containing protein n=1 Tax=Accumulibacter sp. TaxID=2053492 RepID=UPI0025F91BF9|nr:PEP-CTERM sorting domain-containing protein [Accumulibacter sp.]
MEIRFMVRSLAAVAVSAAFAAPALADTVQLNSWTFGGPSSVSVGTPNYSGGAGKFSGFLNSNAFETFCAELTQTFNLGVTYNNYSVVNAVTAWGSARSTALDKVLSFVASAPGTWLYSPDTSAAVQSAVWEVLNETGSSYDFTTGSFKASSSGTTQTALTALNNSLWGSLATQAITVHADKLFSEDHQDFLVITAVPEPETYAMLLAGLGIVGAVGRRRRSASA